jgi:hypothetical protein
MGTLADQGFTEEADKLRETLDDFCWRLEAAMDKGQWYFKLETMLPRRRGIR